MKNSSDPRRWAANCACNGYVWHWINTIFKTIAGVADLKPRPCLCELTPNNNNNGFRVRFGVRRRHRGPPLVMGSQQLILIAGYPDEGEGESGCQSRVSLFHLCKLVTSNNYRGITISPVISKL